MLQGSMASGCLLLILGFVEFVSAVWSSVLACKVACCCQCCRETPVSIKWVTIPDI